MIDSHLIRYEPVFHYAPQELVSRGQFRKTCVQANERQLISILFRLATKTIPTVQISISLTTEDLSIFCGSQPTLLLLHSVSRSAIVDVNNSKWVLTKELNSLFFDNFFLWGEPRLNKFRLTPSLC